jgi:hypothetical protein
MLGEFLLSSQSSQQFVLLTDYKIQKKELICKENFIS